MISAEFRARLVILIISGTFLASSGTSLARDLTFADRVEAQEAIERVYYSHTIGAKRPFDEAVPRASPSVDLDELGRRKAAASSGPAGACAGDDVWLNGILDDTPDPRNFMTAVWTGSEMLIWGGASASGNLDTGERYDPPTDAWTATTLAIGLCP